MKRIGVFTILGLLLFLPCRSLAWHGPGHMTVAKIAYEELKASNPQVLAAIVQMLKQHPHYQEFLSQGRPADVDADEWAFLKAATWSDWIKPPKHPSAHQKDIDVKYNHPHWHFINYPFTVPSDPAKEQELQPKPSSDPEAPTNILEAIALNRGTFSKAGVSDEDKAVSICWLLHLFGDIHQPLHCAMLVNSKFHGPEWDEGGNLLLVLPSDGVQVTNLHSYWDSLVLHDNPQEVDAAAQTIRHQYGRQAFTAELATNDNAAWAQESLKLAKEHAYLNGQLEIVTGREDHPPPHVPTLDAAYVKDATEVAQKQMALGGYRLADQLTAIFKAP